MIQDLVVYAVFIGYGVGVLMTFGTILTWVERKQAAVMADRIGANRAYLRIPFTQDQARLVGAVPRDGRRAQDARQGRLQGRLVRLVRVCGRALGRVHAGAARLRGHSVRRRAPSRDALLRVPDDRRLVRRPDLRAADRAARRRHPHRLRLRRNDDHRRDAGRLGIGEQVLDAGRAARRVADDLLRAHHGPHGARAHPDLRHRRPHDNCAEAVRHRAGLPAGVGRRPPAVRRDAVHGRGDRREQAHPVRSAGSRVRATSPASTPNTAR